MTAREGLERSLARTAGIGTALVFVVVASSAWLRLAAGDPGCPPGGCEAFALADAVRLAHRVAAMAVAVLVLLVVAIAWRVPARPGLRFAAIVLLGLVGALSVIGRASAGNPSGPVVLANLLGGLGLLALVAAVASDAWARTRRIEGPLARSPFVVLVFAAIAIAAGALLASGIVPPTPAATALHRVAGWFAMLASIFLAASGGTPSAARGPLRLAAGAFALSAVVALAGPAGEFSRWLHNVLSAAALVPAVAACALARRQPLPEVREGR